MCLLTITTQPRARRLGTCCTSTRERVQSFAVAVWGGERLSTRKGVGGAGARPDVLEGGNTVAPGPRPQRPQRRGGGELAQYSTDRPYAASSCSGGDQESLSAPRSRPLRTPGPSGPQGPSRSRMHVPRCACRAAGTLRDRVFAPSAGRSTRGPKARSRPPVGENSPYLDMRLTGEVRRPTALNHL